MSVTHVLRIINIFISVTHTHTHTSDIINVFNCIWEGHTRLWCVCDMCGWCVCLSCVVCIMCYISKAWRRHHLCSSRVCVCVCFCVYTLVGVCAHVISIAFAGPTLFSNELVTPTWHQYCKDAVINDSEWSKHVVLYLLKYMYCKYKPLIMSMRIFSVISVVWLSISKETGVALDLEWTGQTTVTFTMSKYERKARWVVFSTYFDWQETPNGWYLYVHTIYKYNRLHSPSCVLHTAGHYMWCLCNPLILSTHTVTTDIP